MRRPYSDFASRPIPIMHINWESAGIVIAVGFVLMGVVGVPIAKWFLICGIVLGIGVALLLRYLRRRLVFERYTERARRVVFFARYEASQFGDREIGDVHLLLGLLREDMGLVYRLLSKAGESAGEGQATIDGLRRKIEEQIGPPRPGVATSADMPLTSFSKRILAYAAEEAELTSQRHIDSEHLMLGILREGGCVAASILKNEGIELAAAREAIGVSSAFAVGIAYGSEVVSPTSARRSERSARFGVLEFVCDGQRIIASVVVPAVSVIPRVGERVIIRSKEGKELAYWVEDVTYIYDSYPPDMAVAPHQLAKVLVRLSGQQQSQSGR